MYHMAAPEVDYYAGDNNRDLVLWQSAHILDSNPDQDQRSPSGSMWALWYDDEDRLCELSTEINPNSHFIRSKNKDKDYAKTRYIFTRTEPDGSSRFTFVIASDRKRIEQRDKHSKPVQRSQRIAEAALLGSIIESYRAFDPDEILLPYNSELGGINEEALFNEIVYQYERDSRLRRIGRKIRSFVGE